MRSITVASGLLTAANLLSGVLGYFYQVLTGRLLDPGEFALLCALMSLAFLFLSPIEVLSLVLVRRIVSSGAPNLQSSLLLEKYKHATKVFLFFSITLISISTIFHNFFASFIAGASAIHIFLLNGFVVAMLFGALNNAFFQSARRFELLACSALCTVSLKLSISIGLILIGFGVTGALAGGFLSVFLINGLLYMVFFKKNIQGIEKSWALSYTFKLVTAKGYIFLVMAALSIGLLRQIDLVFANNFLPNDEAGLYAAVATLGKVNLYLPIGISTVLFPIMIDKDIPVDKLIRTLLAALGLSLLMSMIAVAVFWIFGDEIILFLFGEQYRGAGSLLKFYSLAITPLALLVIVQNTLIAIGSKKFALATIVLAGMQILIFLSYHSTAMQILSGLGVGACLNLLVGLLFFGNFILKAGGNIVRRT